MRCTSRTSTICGYLLPCLALLGSNSASLRLTHCCTRVPNRRRWDYLYFLVYLRHKPATEYTGAESFLSRCITEESPEWIPIGKALELEDSEEDREATVQQTLESLQHALLHRHEEGRDLMHRIEMDQKSTMSELRVLRNEIDTKMRQLNKAVATKGSATHTTDGYPAALGTDSEQHREEAAAGGGGGGEIRY